MLRCSDGQLWGAEAEKLGSTQKWKTEDIPSGEDGVKYGIYEGGLMQSLQKSWRYVEEMIYSM